MYTTGQDGESGGRGVVSGRLGRTVAELRLLSSPTLVVFSRRPADIAADHVLSRVPEYRPPTSTWRSSAHRHRYNQACERRSDNCFTLS